jgi:hypothetical protein
MEKKRDVDIEEKEKRKSPQPAKRMMGQGEKGEDGGEEGDEGRSEIITLESWSRRGEKPGRRPLSRRFSPADSAQDEGRWIDRLRRAWRLKQGLKPGANDRE